MCYLFCGERHTHTHNSYCVYAMMFFLSTIIICLHACLFLKEEYKDLETQLNKSFSEFIRQTFSFIHGMLNKAAHIEQSEQRK